MVFFSEETPLELIRELRPDVLVKGADYCRHEVPGADFGSVPVVGFGMLPRGEVGLIFAQIGLSTGILSSELFSAILLMVIGTTFIAPFLLKWSFRRWGTNSSPTR